MVFARYLQIDKATATLLLANLAKIAKSFFLLSMDPLLLNDCPIPIFNGLGGHGLSFPSLGQ